VFSLGNKKNMNSISKLVAAAALLVAGTSFGQIYTVMQQSQPYAGLSGAGVIPVAFNARSTTFDATDEGWLDLAIGFNFPYYGTNYGTVHIDSNGFLMFGPAVSTTCISGFTCYSGGGIPSTTRTPHSVIAPWWRD